MRKYPLLVFLIALCLLALPVSAQDTNVIADGLNNPRGLYFDDNGVLWITEAGTSGDFTGQTDLGPVKFGGTAQVLKVMPGSAGATPVLGGLPSSQEFDDVVGVSSIYADANGIWLVTGLGPLADPFNMSLIQLNPQTLRPQQFVDLYSYEADNNPDQDVIMSNPSDVAVGDDGTMYIVDTSGNDLLTWTPSGGLQLFHVWLDLYVPTSVDIGQDGSIYVGFLSPFPYTTGSARIEKWSPDGTLLDTYTGLTAVTDVLVDPSGTLYAVQLASSYGDLGFVGNSGSVVTVSDSGITPVAEGLNYPYRLAMSADGALAVTVNSAFSAPGSGEVIALSGELTVMQPQPPAQTPEAPNETPEAPASTPEAPNGTPEVGG